MTTSRDARSTTGRSTARRIVSVAFILALASMWWFLEAVVRLLYLQRIPVLSERVMRARQEYDLDFYLEATFAGRFLLTVGFVALGLVLAMAEVAEDTKRTGGAVRCIAASFYRLNSWFPASMLGRVAVIVAGSTAIALSDGYRMIGTLGSDLVAYAVAARKHFESDYLVGDLAIRDADPSLMLYGRIVGALARVFGFDQAFLAVTVLGSSIMVYGIYRLATRTLASSPATGYLAGVTGLGATFGTFGYTLSLASNAEFVPTPRFLAVALAILSMSFVAEACLVRGVLIGLLAASVNTLDGIVPVGLSLLALIVARPFHEDRVRLRMASVGLLASGVVVLAPAVLGRSAATMLGDTRSLGVVLLGAVVVASVWWLITRAAIGLVMSRLAPVVWLVVFAVGSVLVARRRAASTGEFLENVVAFETVLVRVRQGPSMLVLSSTSTRSAAIFVALAFLTIGLSATLKGSRSQISMERAHRLDGATFLTTLVVLTVAFLGIGSLLMEWTGTPFMITLWPLRAVWVIVLAAVLIAAAHLERTRLQLGFIPAFALGMLLVQGPLLGRVGWSAALMVLISLHVLGRMQTRRNVRSVGLRPEGLVRRFARLVLGVTPPAVLVGVLSVFPVPEVRLSDSMNRFAAGGSELEEGVISMARIARAGTPPDARVLVPPVPAWGAFRLMSDRGVAFEWKTFSTSEPVLWYSQLRQMCDPEYVWQSDETYEIGGPEVRACHDSLEVAEILRVAEAFGATHAVVRTDVAAEVPGLVLGRSELGGYALIEVPPGAPR